VNAHFPPDALSPTCGASLRRTATPILCAHSHSQSAKSRSDLKSKRALSQPGRLSHVGALQALRRICHQAKAMTGKARALGVLAQEAEVHFPVVLLKEDVLAVVPPPGTTIRASLGTRRAWQGVS
jgi:hypothetical protein